MKITVSQMRSLEKQVLQGEISYSRMIEILNETVSVPESKSVVLSEIEIKELNFMFIDFTFGKGSYTEQFLTQTHKEFMLTKQMAAYKREQEKRDKKLSLPNTVEENK